jgi:hypothetical protein
MGRYYNGDVEGKFWFAIQGSDAPERFGAFERDSGYIDYAINRESLPEIIEEIKSIESNPKVQFLMKLFDESDTISITEAWKKENGISKEDLAEYADLTLGRKIRDFFEYDSHNEYCEIQADL